MANEKPPAKPAPPKLVLPPLVPFVPPDRARVDQNEPAPSGTGPVGSDREWIGYGQQGGGKIPGSFSWPHSPKQRQDEEM